NTNNAPLPPFSGDPSGTTVAYSTALGFAPYSYAGSLADIRIWNVARSSTQVTSDYQMTSPVGQTGLQAYWPMLEGSGTTTADSSGNGFTATLNGGVTFVPAAPTATSTATSTSTPTATSTATPTSTA